MDVDCSNINPALANILKNPRLNIKLGITSLRALRLYEIIYCLHKLNNGAEGEKLRFLYRYQYCLTAGEKKQNPAWGEFMRAMDILYSCEENG